MCYTPVSCLHCYCLLPCSSECFNTAFNRLLLKLSPSLTPRSRQDGAEHDCSALAGKYSKRMRNGASPEAGNLPESMAHDIQQTGKSPSSASYALHQSGVRPANNVRPRWLVCLLSADLASHDNILPRHHRTHSC
jgi:hypothetical protein